MQGVVVVIHKVVDGVVDNFVVVVLLWINGVWWEEEHTFARALPQ